MTCQPSQSLLRIAIIRQAGSFPAQKVREADDIQDLPLPPELVIALADSRGHPSCPKRLKT